jgi:hypothetical protein
MLLEQVGEPRHEARVKDEGQRRAEELWAESERRAVARRKAEEGLHRLAALGARHLRGVYARRAEEYLRVVESLEGSFR